MGEGDVFVTVQERRVRGAGAPGHPARPVGFGPDTGCGTGDPACAEGASLGIEGLRAWWIPFTDPSTGRAFYAFVAMGEEAYRDPARSSAAWTILDSMTFGDEIYADARPGAVGKPAELPPPIRDDYRSEFVSDERGNRFWPRSGQVQEGVVYRFEVPHCGLDWLVDFDGSFWDGRLIVDAGPGWVPPDEIPDGDVGTMELVGPGLVLYESSAGGWTLLSRVDGPVVRQPCD
jgi:hypothetical protein